ncbi:hypothetical protein HYS31_01395 [Candidatus Woesearchaeota archaeon]|nr:hypothetical protein [Candidatus Woesearchaeota archaeon]
MKAIKLIPQKQGSQCGIACIMMVTGQPHNKYNKVKASLFNKDKKNNFHTRNPKIIESIKRFSKKKYRKLRFVGFTDWDYLKLRKGNFKAIVSVNVNDDSPNWHWIVFEKIGDKSRTLDPSPTNEGRISYHFERKKAISCLIL